MLAVIVCSVEEKNKLRESGSKYTKEEISWKKEEVREARQQVE